MKKLYLRAYASSEHFNVDVYPPTPSALASKQEIRRPVVILIGGGGGKDLHTGDPVRGKFGAAYHDLAESLAASGFWVFVPSRRGDPKRTVACRAALLSLFEDRLPEELFSDSGENEGRHSHRRQVEELRALIEYLPTFQDQGLDTARIGLLGKSAGGGIALCLATELPNSISTILLWGCALKSSQWFTGPKADHFFRRIFDSRGIKYDREEFKKDICDAIDFVGTVRVPMLFACAAPDPYAPQPPATDEWSDAEEQLQMLRYAINCRHAGVSIIKGAEHTMYREMPAWRNYICAIRSWFNETLSDISYERHSPVMVIDN